MAMFHVERFLKTLLRKGFFVFLTVILFTACITPRHTVEINDYVLLPNGKEVLGKEKGLMAFIFENNKRKAPFQEFLVEKYKLGATQEIWYYVIVDGIRLKVFLYDNAELEKYFDTSQFMISNVETEVNRIGSSVDFLALSVISETNEDCLAEGSLYQGMAIKYLKALKDEYNYN
jgi:hypothetical protein